MVIDAEEDTIVEVGVEDGKEDVDVEDGSVDLKRGSRGLFLNAICVNLFLPNSTNIQN